jgi:predicted Zn-ribbon and HTH transcriptional regulator
LEQSESAIDKLANILAERLSAKILEKMPKPEEPKKVTMEEWIESVVKGLQDYPQAKKVVYEKVFKTPYACVGCGYPLTEDEVKKLGACPECGSTKARKR